MSKIFGKIADYIRETDKQFFILCIAASLYGSLLVLSASRAIGQTRQFFVHNSWALHIPVCVYIFLWLYPGRHRQQGMDRTARWDVAAAVGDYKSMFYSYICISYLSAGR